MFGLVLALVQRVAALAMLAVVSALPSDEYDRNLLKEELHRFLR
jgi:hypothetical protein